MMRVPCFFFFSLILTLAALAEETLLLRSPTVSDQNVAFVYAGDIWVSKLQDAAHGNGEARRLTVHPGVESNPVFSPDGKRIAFTGDYDGNPDVYVIALEGGAPERLTFHPGDDTVRGWSPDGSRVLFHSFRLAHTLRRGQLFTVPLTGGLPEALPMPDAVLGAFAPDGTRLAYTPFRQVTGTWKSYRGGTTPPIWIFDLETHEIEEITHVNATDTSPAWLDDKVYFLSDRNGRMNLFTFDTHTREVRQITRHDDFDVKSVSAGAGGIVYEQAGRLHWIDPDMDNHLALSIRVNPDLPHIRPHYAKAADFIQRGSISPTGARAVFSARGDLFSVPEKKGDIRNLTRTPGINERFPAWSPDGKWIAAFSDTSGEYQLMIYDQKGFEPPRVIDPGAKTFFYNPIWSPDSKKIAYTDKRLNLWCLDLESEQSVRVDTDTYDVPPRSLNPAWSPDSQWLAYSKRLDNFMHTIFLYNVQEQTARAVTDGMSNAVSPAFSRNGKYLFFAASTNFGLQSSWLDMTSYERPVVRNLYVSVLNMKDPSPFAPESDEESIEEKEEKKPDSEATEKADKKAKDNHKKKKTVEVVIDFEGLDQRILSLPVPGRDIRGLQTAMQGKLFYLETVPNQPGRTLHRFDMKKRKTEKVLDTVFTYQISHDGKKWLGRGQGNSWFMADTAMPITPQPATTKLNLKTMEVRVEPRAEWQQIFNEVWRIQRDFFYDPFMHGADWDEVREKYRPFLAHLGHRSDLNFLLSEMIGELVVGHAYVDGGDMPEVEQVSAGLLGAWFREENGLYRIVSILSGENWNPDLRAPLTEPGVEVNEGDYLLAVNGRPLTAAMNPYRLFEKTANKQTVLRLNSQPGDEGAREVTVLPIRNEVRLRYRAWVENNRRKVDEATQGKVAYLHMPNTAGAGYTSFNRYFFAQQDKQAVIIDERDNGGGSVADYVIDLLRRPIFNYMATREGKVQSTPSATLPGPKVMIVNQDAGSGGDAMPYYFRQMGLGKLVGTRTWGGLVGIYDNPPLMDNGFISAPRIAFFHRDGSDWIVENEGVAPDIEVVMTPKSVIAGGDPQLEKAIEVILEELATNPVTEPAIPEYPKRAL